MAGVVVSDSRFKAGDVRGNSQKRRRQNLGQILDPLAKPSPALRPTRIVVEQMAVFLQRRTTASGVREDGVEFEFFKNLDVAAGAAAGLFQVAAMRVESATTNLGRRRHDIVAGQLSKRTVAALVAPNITLCTQP